MKPTDLENVASLPHLMEGAAPVDPQAQAPNPVDGGAANYLACARPRLADIDSDCVAAVPGNDVFEKVCRRLDSTEMLARSQTAGRSYEETLAARIVAADQGLFASEAEIARFFVEHGE